MHNFAVGIVNGSYMFRPGDSYFMQPKYVAVIYNCYNKVVYWRVIFLIMVYI
jgi:hypothetical protein